MAEVSDIEILRPFFCDSQSIFNVTVSKSTLSGQGLFATQFLKKGSLLFINKPIVYGPRANCTIEKFCSYCYQVNNLCYSCEKCYTFVCSENCKNSDDHKQMCILICTNWILNETTDSVESTSIVLSRVIIYLRFLLLSEEQKSLLRLFQRSDITSKFEELETLQTKFHIPEEQIEFLRIANSIIKINSFRISNAHKAKTVELRGFYPVSAFMNHTCVPNTRNIFTKEYAMAIFVSKDIKKGDEITCCYTGILWCTPARRFQLYKSKKFWCKCTRCSDPTEMNTKLSALKCLNKECIGILLPKTPLDPQTKWLCDTCSTIVPLEKINMIHSALGSLVGTLKLDDEFRMNNAVLKKLAMFIPYSNHIFVDIRLRLALKLGFMDGDHLNGIINRNLISFNKTNLNN